MVWQQQNNTGMQSKKVNPEEIADMTLKHAADYKFMIAQKVASNESINYDSFKRFFIMLVGDAESACIGCRYIAKYKKKFDEEELDENETTCLNALRVYFKNLLKEGSPNIAFASAEIKARQMLREAIEGEYYSKINEKKLELFVPEQKYSEQEILQKNFDLANYRFELILEAITSQKTIRKNLNA